MSKWVREASKLPRSGLPSPDARHERTPRAGGHDTHAVRRGGAHPDDEEPDESAVYVSAKPRGGHGRASDEGRRAHSKQRRGWEEEDAACSDEDELQPPAGVLKPGVPSAPASVAESASIAGGSSMGSQSEGGGGSISSAADTAHDEDLAIDSR